MNPSGLQAEAEPYIPLAYAGLPPTGPSFPPPPPLSFFAPTAPFVYLAPPPPPQAGFLGGVQGCWDTPMAPGGVGMHCAFPHHPAWLPLMPVPHGAIAMPPAPPSVTAGAMPQGSGSASGKQHPRSERAGRSPCARPRPHLVVPPRMQAARCPRAPEAANPGAKAADAGGDGAAKEEPANEPSPRSVLVTQSPPISPTTSLPSTFPLPCLPPAPAAPAPPTEPPHASAELGTVSPPVSPPKRMKPPRPRRVQLRRPRRSVPKPRALFDPDSNHTSLMIRHIPNDFTKERLMAIIDQHCFIENERIATGGVRSEYDFLYLPIDFRTLANKGYAFVNMTSPDAARRLWEHLNGHRWEVRRCAKTCAVDNGAIQGLDKLVDHFSGSIFPCYTEEFLPARFAPPRDGTRPFEVVVHVVGRLARRL